jgi:hypothetical protein
VSVEAPTSSMKQKAESTCIPDVDNENDTAGMILPETEHINSASKQILEAVAVLPLVTCVAENELILTI